MRYRIKLDLIDNEIKVVVSVTGINSSNCMEEAFLKPSQYFYFIKGKKIGKLKQPNMVDAHMQKIKDMLSSLEKVIRG